MIKYLLGVATPFVALFVGFVIAPIDTLIFVDTVMTKLLVLSSYVAQ